MANKIVDRGNHYAHIYRRNLKPEDIERGYVEVKLDPARIINVYSKNAPMHQMACGILKKSLRGGMGHKELLDDIKDIQAYCERWIEMIEEDE